MYDGDLDMDADFLDVISNLCDSGPDLTPEKNEYNYDNLLVKEERMDFTLYGGHEQTPFLHHNDEESLTVAAGLCPSQRGRLDSTESTLAMGEGSGGRRKRARVSQDDEDAKLIAFETESHLKKLNIDPDSREGKIERRKIQNRMSAQMHRERKRAYIESLEEELRGRDATILKLRCHIQSLEDRLAQLGEPATIGVRDKPSAGGSACQATTSESESDDTSSLSSLEGTSGFSSSRAPFGLSLFSLFFMISCGFTFLSRPDLLGDFLGKSSSLPLSSDSGEWASHGRVLLAAGPSNDALNPNVFALAVSEEQGQDDHTGSDEDNADPIASDQWWRKTSVTSNSSLWNTEEHVAQLYPHEHLIGGNPTGSVSGTSNALIPAYPLIGASPDQGARNSGQSSLRGSTSHTISSVVANKALVAKSSVSMNSAERFSRRSAPDGDNQEFSNSFSSHIIMTEGKALLDPALIHTSMMDQNPSYRSRGFTFGGGDTAANPSKNSKLRYNGYDVSHALVASSHFKSDSSDGATTSILQQPSAVGISSPQFIMMVPLSSVRWGSSWSDEDSMSNPLRHFLKTLKNGQNETKSEWQGEDEGANSFWIEIGCSVVSAQLVRNVTMTS